MSLQQTKNILTRLITKVKSILTQVNKNTTAIKALGTGGGSGGQKTWTNITTSYGSRKWTHGDIGKMIRFDVNLPTLGQTSIIAVVNIWIDPYFSEESFIFDTISSYHKIFDKQGFNNGDNAPFNTKTTLSNAMVISTIVGSTTGGAGGYNTQSFGGALSITGIYILE